MNIEEMEQEHTRLALSEGPITYALLQTLRGIYEFGVSEPDIAELVQEARRLRSQKSPAVIKPDAVQEERAEPAAADAVWLDDDEASRIVRPEATRLRGA